MAAKVSLKDFIDEIFSLNATVSTKYGSALSAGSRDMSGGGGYNSAGIVTLKLRTDTAEFGELVSNNGSKSDILTKAKDIEGDIMTLQTLGQISQSLCSKLIDNPQDLIA